MRRGAMSYASLLIPVDPSPQSVDRIALAADLADRFQARLFGVAAREPDLQAYTDITVPNERLLRAEEKRIEEELSQAETLFRRALGDRNERYARKLVTA